MIVRARTGGVSASAFCLIIDFGLLLSASATVLGVPRSLSANDSGD